MDKGLALTLTAICGGLVGAQAPINGRLGEAVGSFPAAAISFMTGGALLIAIALAFGGGFGGVTDTGLPWYYFVGGLLGAAYVSTALVAVGSLGAGGVVAATVAGQLTASIAIDAIGAFGLDKQPITIARMAGVVLLAAGTYLIVAVD